MIDIALKYGDNLNSNIHKKTMDQIKLSISDCLKPQFPHLLRNIKKVIEKTEKDFSSKENREDESFLWEHTLLVSTIAYEICVTQGEPPLLPLIASLFHDAGKFHRGEYHANNISEEQYSAELAEQILSKQGMKQSQIYEITSSLESLYDEDKPMTWIAEIVHDADFLAKSGHMGIAYFFIKSTLRGHALIKSLTESLSREMTYASVLPQNMNTETGKKRALQKKKDILTFFKGLIKELNDHGATSLEIKKIPWPCPKNNKKTIPVSLVVPSACPQCREEIRVFSSTQKGIKCTELVTDLKCIKCSWNNQTSFCLPEICP